jgi:hypothetical protein
MVGSESISVSMSCMMLKDVPFSRKEEESDENLCEYRI